MDANRQEKPNITLAEKELSEDILSELIRFSEDWEAEQSCHGYRRNQKEDIDGNRIFLAFDGKRTVGYLFGHFSESESSTSIMPDGTPIFEIEEIYVRPEYRNKGIGSRLFDFAEKTVSPEAEFIMLSTATKNWKAILHFYIEELGMNFWSARLYKKIQQ